MAHFDIRNLNFSYPDGQLCLDNINLSVEKGEYVLLCGQSGSGKTTLLRHLKTVLSPHGSRSGNIFFNGTPLEEASPAEQAAKIGFVMQNPDEQIVTDKVWHELSFGLENLGCDPGIMRLRVAEMASYFGIQDWFHREIGELSGGQKQLLNLAAIMAMQPEVLILDEPTSQLDPLAAADFLATLRKINTELGTTILITEHRLEEIYPTADRVVVMDGGKIFAEGDPRTVGQTLWQQGHPMFSALPTPVRVFYGAKPKGACPLTVREGRRWLTEQLEGKPLAVSSPERKPSSFDSQEPALAIRELWFRYEKDSPDILKGVSLQVPKGSLFAIMGGNGTGKTTLLKAVCAAVKPYRGNVKLLGKPLAKHISLFQGCLAMLPQDPRSLFVKKSVRLDLMEMTRNLEEIDRIAKLCQIEWLLDAHPWDLSGGEQQRCALAKVLLTQPKLLLLDEPTKGIDPFFKTRFAQILQTLKQEGITVIMVSHDAEFCAEHADFVGMFFDGQILTVNTPGQFFGQNSFYTTAANRMSRCVFQNAVTGADVIDLYRKNGGASE